MLKNPSDAKQNHSRKFTSTAYLHMLHMVIDGIPYFWDLRIMSDRHPTLMSNMVSMIVMESTKDSFQEALDDLENQVRLFPEYSSNAWMKNWVLNREQSFKKINDHQTIVISTRNTFFKVRNQ